MGFLGLVPSEYSSGSTRRQGAITKTGNGHARRVLVEAAWNYRAQSRLKAQWRGMGGTDRFGSGRSSYFCLAKACPLPTSRQAPSHSTIQLQSAEARGLSRRLAVRLHSYRHL
jgi:hypothetical protein